MYHDVQLSMSFEINVEISNDEAAGPTGAVPTELTGDPDIGYDPCASDLQGLIVGGGEKRHRARQEQI